ncbi:hypothetical protein [Citrobacter sp. Marseille-Q6884]|uniref:hypothetical protein n=1 Tax=Citrobacter sp. Marseille-Q6884 TaxID=2956786 RepID=UPI0021B47638|nr:hypothetical protein [Citrobacter sp. Marseille-Q6884]EMF0718797.1 hypothetical protein [Citrobacter freundii]
MTPLINLAAVRITLGEQDFYIPANQVKRCALVTQVLPEIPRFSQWLGIADEPQTGRHLHLFVPDSGVECGWYLWGQLENVLLSSDTIFAVPPLLAHGCRLPALRALVGTEAFSPLLSWR